MSGILKMPRMGETMDEGKLIAWLVEPGQPFKRGDPILEVETDKTVVEFPALGDGMLVESLVEIGEMVDVGTAIAKIDVCLLYTSPSPRDQRGSRMPSSA